MITRRDLLRILLAAPIAATVDVERLLWVPKPIIVVPAMPSPQTIKKFIYYYGVDWVKWEGLDQDHSVIYGFGPNLPPGKVFIKRIRS